MNSPRRRSGRRRAVAVVAFMAAAFQRQFVRALLQGAVKG